jgi:penicillin-binding protein-related factor A (putative recombinase)
LAKKNQGKAFEEQLQLSSKNTKLFFYRIKDQSIPIEMRSKVPVSKNKYDCIIFDSGHLFTLELKSTGNKSISFDEKIIKQHQIDNLVEANTYDGVISGFIFNFREYENATYFVGIDEFNKYKDVAQSESSESSYVKLNKSSIPLEVCEQIGVKIQCYKKRTNFHYHIKTFVEEAIVRYGGSNEI